MKRRNVVLMIIILYGLLSAGCGKKGDLVIPPVPEPNPISNTSATVTDEAIVLSWDAPTSYNTGKPLDLMQDIETITISRKQESSTDHRWDFSLSRDGWAAGRQTRPIKWSQGVLRVASTGKTAFLTSPDNLALSASQYRYISLKLWTRHADQAYIAFITSDDEQWDDDPELRFQPAVHTSFLAYQRVFASRKLKALPLLPEHITAGQVYEYIVDMQELPAWKGTIQQISVLAYTATPHAGELEMGLEQLSLLETSQPPASIRDAPPWLFLQDEEGWRVSPYHTSLMGTASGALYLESQAEPLLAMSASGQDVGWRQVRQIQIRMKTIGANTAYVLLRSAQDSPFEKRDLTELTPSKMVIPFPLRTSDEFQVYTIPCPDLSDAPDMFSQIGILFPGGQHSQKRQILIDYVALGESPQETTAFLPALSQKDILPLADVANIVRQQHASRVQMFNSDYEALSESEEVFHDDGSTLVRVSPQDPEPLEINEDGSFTFRDAGGSGSGDADDISFQRGERYTYTIKLIDRKGRAAEQAETLTVNFPSIPTAPGALSAAARDREVHLTWKRPFRDTNGEKMRAFDGYHIYRTSTPGQNVGPPLHQAGVNDTSFVDVNVVNGNTYYYVVQAVASVTDTVVVGETSPEVSATPMDNQAPDAPADLKGWYLPGGAVRLSWRDVSATPDRKGYYVYRRLSAKGQFDRIHTQSFRQLNYDDDKVELQQTYYYYVTAFDKAEPPNESQPSNVIQVKTGRR
jgi:predicted small lipoprotein YifL